MVSKSSTDRTRTRLYTISVSCSKVMSCKVIAGVYSNTLGSGLSTVEERYGSWAPLIADEMSSSFQWYQPEETMVQGLGFEGY